MATAIDESVKSNNAAKRTTDSVNRCNEVTLDWLNVFSQVYRETLTPELIIAYQTALTGVNPQILHKAFLRAMKSSTFRPTPAEVLQAAAIEFEGVPKPKQLEAPPMTDEERAEVSRSFDELRERLSLPPRSKVNEKQRHAELRRQAREIIARHPAPEKKKRA